MDTNAGFGWTVADTCEPSKTRLNQLRKNVLFFSQNRLERRASLPSLVDANDSCLGSELPSITSEESYSECSSIHLRALRHLNSSTVTQSFTKALQNAYNARSYSFLLGDLQEVHSDLTNMADKLSHLTTLLKTTKPSSPESAIDLTALNEETMADLVHRVLKQTCHLHLSKQEGVDVSLIV